MDGGFPRKLFNLPGTKESYPSTRVTDHPHNARSVSSISTYLGRTRRPRGCNGKP